MPSTSAPTPAPTEAPKPANPEPLQEAIDPEKGRVKTPQPGRSEHANARRDRLERALARDC